MDMIPYEQPDFRQFFFLRDFGAPVISKAAGLVVPSQEELTRQINELWAEIELDEYERRLRNMKFGCPDSL